MCFDAYWMQLFIASILGPSGDIKEICLVLFARMNWLARLSYYLFSDRLMARMRTKDGGYVNGSKS